MDLPITFGDPTNYKMETLTFEVVGFHGTYHAILGHPCYAKFMAVPNYTNLKLKMLGPCRVITIDTSFQRAYECEVECCDHTSAAVVAEKTPDAKTTTVSFKPAEGSMEVHVDPSGSEAKRVRTGTSLSSK